MDKTDSDKTNHASSREKKVGPAATPATSKPKAAETKKKETVSIENGDDGGELKAASKEDAASTFASELASGTVRQVGVWTKPSCEEFAELLTPFRDSPLSR